MSKGRSYEEELMGYLKDQQRAVAYLNAALEDGDPDMFLIALKNVAKARGKFIDISEANQVSESGHINWKIHHFLSLLKDLGLGLAFIETNKANIAKG